MSITYKVLMMGTKHDVCCQGRGGHQRDCIYHCHGAVTVCLSLLIHYRVCACVYCNANVWLNLMRIRYIEFGGINKSDFGFTNRTPALYHKSLSWYIILCVCRVGRGNLLIDYFPIGKECQRVDTINTHYQNGVNPLAI